MFKKTVGAAFLAAVLVGPAHALTIGYTEGSRDLVDGTQKLGDASSGPLGSNLGVLGFGASQYRQIDLHGRIVSATDFFSFSATSNFIVEFIFGPISVNNGARMIDGGFNQEGNKANKSEFVLDLSAMSESKTFQTNILSEADNMGTSLIFKAMAGSPYTLLGSKRTRQQPERCRHLRHPVDRCAGTGSTPASCRGPWYPWFHEMAQKAARVRLPGKTNFQGGPPGPSFPLVAERRLPVEADHHSSEQQIRQTHQCQRLVQVSGANRNLT